MTQCADVGCAEKNVARYRHGKPPEGLVAGLVKKRVESLAMRTPRLVKDSWTGPLSDGLGVIVGTLLLLLLTPVLIWGWMRQLLNRG